MIVQLTDKRNIILNWKVSANLNYGILYCITIIITVSIVVLLLRLVRGITYSISSLRYSLVNLWNLCLVITMNRNKTSK